MTSKTVKPLRCAIYTRVSTDHGLEQDFNSLDAQYDAATAPLENEPPPDAEGGKQSGS